LATTDILLVLTLEWWIFMLW